MHTKLLLNAVYFYPRPPRGGRRQQKNQKQSLKHFYPRPPRGGRPTSLPTCTQSVVFLSTPSARRATYDSRSSGPDIAISIHALREEGDRSVRWWLRCASRFLSTPSARRATWSCFAPHRKSCDFYPRPPRGGRRYWILRRCSCWRFLSTPSARRATFAFVSLSKAF